MIKQLKTIEILNPSKSATCSMWRYPESAKIFQDRGVDFDGFRVVRVKGLLYRVKPVNAFGKFLLNGSMYKNQPAKGSAKFVVPLMRKQLNVFRLVILIPLCGISVLR